MLIYSIADKGLVRKTNQDYHRYDRDRQLILLADGVGGHAHGEIASQVAVESAWQYLLRNETLVETERLDLGDALAECMAFANQKVLSQQGIKPSYYNMGTTLVASCLQDKVLHFAWVGDSRVYRFCHQTQFIEQLTIDHTLLQENQSKAGGKAEDEEPERDISGNIITRMIGSMYNAKPGLGKVAVNSGDLILVCSDGLSDQVSDGLIRDCLMLHRRSLSDGPGALRDLAYQKGARDNISVVLGLVP